jgi:hypothetical protein
VAAIKGGEDRFRNQCEANELDFKGPGKDPTILPSEKYGCCLMQSYDVGYYLQPELAGSRFRTENCQFRLELG